MKNYIFFTTLMLATQLSLATQCNPGGQQLEVQECKNSMLCASTGQIKEVIDDEYIEGDTISCIDVNFDGEPDVVVEHQPAGQIRQSSVFIFDKTDRIYKKNQVLSDIPCLKVDVDKKLISGECFSSSVCDRWTEQYRVRGNSLELVSTKGTYCDPATGEAYSYFETYENGQIIEKIVEPLIEGE